MTFSDVCMKAAESTFGLSAVALRRAEFLHGVGGIVGMVTADSYKEWWLGAGHLFLSICKSIQLELCPDDFFSASNTLHSFAI